MCVLPLNLNLVESKEVIAYGKFFSNPYNRIYVFNSHKCRLVVYYIHNVD